MHAIVCIKQVPDSSEIRIDPKTNTLVREGVPSVINPHDVHALEAALRMKDRFGGRVTVVSMGPPAAVQSMRRAISLGCDRAILCTDRAFAAADTFATSYVLATAIQRVIAEEGPIEFIFCGRQTIDGDTGQVGPGIARRMGYPILSFAIDIRDVDLARREIVVERKLEEAREVVRAKLPCVISCEKELNTLRYASLPNLIRSLHYEPDYWSMEDLGLKREDVGLRGSPTIVAKSFTPPPREGSVEMLAGTPEEQAKALADRLIGNPVLQGRHLARA